ncbi:hypothetical protein TNCV_3022911 [Trichonephila clavipes]|nr:hypothetical protein TNCV_3022911 [Trichonephila clavipes]
MQRFGYRRVRQTDMVDRIDLSAPTSREDRQIVPQWSVRKTSHCWSTLDAEHAGDSRRYWYDERGCGLQNGMKLSLLPSHASVCNTTMVGFDSGDTVERGY